MCRPFPCGPFCLSCLPPFLLASLLVVTPCHCPVRPSISRPLIRPSSHQAIGPSIWPSFRPYLSSQRSPFSRVSFPAVSYSGFHPGAVRPPQSFQLLLRSCTTGLPGGLPEILPGDSSPRLFPKNCAGALFQNRLACRSPSARLPPASCRLTLAIPARGFFPWMSS